MGRLAIRLQTIVAALPVLLQRAVWTAIGPRSAWGWLTPLTPWLLALATGGIVAGVALVILEAAFDFQPLAVVGVAALGSVVGVGMVGLVRPAGAGLGLQLAAAVAGAIIGAALGTVFSLPLVDAPLPSATGAGLIVGLLVLARRLQIAGAARAAAENADLVSTTIWLLLLLAAVPVLQAGAEATVTPATVAEVVERDVGGRLVIDTRGLALLARFRAEPPVDSERGPDPRRYTWYALRDEPGDREAALIRSTLDPASLRRQVVVARVVSDPEAVRATVTALAARGELVGPEPGDRILLALNPDDQAAAEPVDAASLAEIAEVDPGTVVRLTLDFPGEGVAACVASGRCQARRLGGGIGQWEHLASSPGGGATVVVRAPYPPSLAPLHVVGRQVRDPGPVSRFVALPWARELLGWAQVLRGAIIQHDQSLPVDRLWLGPIAFAGLAAMLAYGRSVGYPVFAGRRVRFGRWSTVETVGWREISARVSGRLTPPDRSPMQLDGADAVIRPAVASGPTIELLGQREPVVVAVPHELGTWSALHVGELRYVLDRQPAVRASWYGSQLQLVFETDADRDAAADMLRAGVGR